MTRNYSIGVPVAPPALRRRLSVAHGEYRIDLFQRTLRIACPVCNAKPKEPCVCKGRLVTWTHYQRRNEAKRAGLLRGRFF